MTSISKNNEAYEQWLLAHQNKQMFDSVLKDCVDQLKQVEKFTLRYQNNFLDCADQHNHFVNTLDFKNDAMVACCTILRVIDKLFAL